jgi:hypothetical protein
VYRYDNAVETAIPGLTTLEVLDLRTFGMVTNAAVRVLTGLPHSANWLLPS